MNQDLPWISELRRKTAMRTTFLSNLSWLTLENIVQALASLIITVGVARILGPDALGIWTYALAIYSLAAVVSSLGTDQIVVLDIVKGEKTAGSIIATAAALRLCASIVASMGMVGLVLTRPAHESDAALLLAVMALAVPMMSIDVIRMWFRASTNFRPPALASITTVFLGSVAKVVLVVATGSIIYAGLAHVVQMAALEVAFVVLLVTTYGKVSPSDVDGAYAKSLLRASVPLLLADLAILVYTRANVLLLEALRSTAEVGIFSAAARISEALYMLPMVFSAVASPAMYRLYNENKPLFLRRFDQVLVGMTLVTVLLCAPIALFADRITSLLFGAGFAPSGFVLSVHVWTALFVAHGVVSSIWLLAEKATMISFWRTLAGAVLNILLGLVLIPRFGAVGAAIATLVAMAASSMIVLLFAGDMGREILGHQLRSLVLMPLWSRKLST